MNRKFHWHSINFSQNFYPICKVKAKPLFTIYRFNVFRYIPIKPKFSNVKYYLLSDKNYGSDESALVGICDYLNDGVMKQDCKVLIRKGDRQVFHLIKLALLQKLANKKIVSEKKSGMVEVDDNE